MRTILISILLLLICGCNTMPKPTDIYQSDQTSGRVENVVLDENKVVVDSRDFMDHSLTKLSGSIFLNWREFAQMGASSDTRVNANHRGLTRRLATYGIQPNSNVVIVGKIHEGRGEAGRLAWTLLYLGVEKIEILEVEALSDVHFDSRNQGKRRESVKVWEREPRKELEVERKELIEAAMMTERENRPLIIDVRSEKEYLARSKDHPQIGAINIDWRQFFSQSGRPDRSILRKISALGITPQKRIILVSDRGVRSGAAAYAMYRMGFMRVGNYSPGLSTLVDQGGSKKP